MAMTIISTEQAMQWFNLNPSARARRGWITTDNLNG
jgi:hypothetical protein